MLIRQGLSGRVQPIIAQYLAEPATCCMCSRPPRVIDETFLNLGVELDYFGFLYLCGDCAVEIGESVSSLPYERAQELERRNLALERENIENAYQIAYLKGLLNARIDLARSGVISSDDDVSVPVLETESVADDFDSIINGIKSDAAESSED